MHPTVLDPCCGSRMMWFDKQDQRVLFGDQRTESHALSDGRALEWHIQDYIKETGISTASKTAADLFYDSQIKQKSK